MLFPSFCWENSCSLDSDGIAGVDDLSDSLTESNTLFRFLLLPQNDTKSPQRYKNNTLPTGMETLWSE